jgi:hypothetical protein
MEDWQIARLTNSIRLVGWCILWGFIILTFLHK